MRVIVWLLALLVAGLAGYILVDHFWPGGSGQLVVLSEPPGAQIFVDLQVAGETNSTIRVPSGQHSVLVKQDSMVAAPFAQVVMVASGKLDTVRFKLTKQEPVAVKPPVPKKPVEAPESSPLDLTAPIKPLTEQEMTKEERAQDTIRNWRPDQATPDRQLAPQTPRSDTTTAMGMLEVSSSVPGAKIFVNGILDSAVTPARLTLPLGAHTIHVELAGYKVDPADQTVRIGRATTVQTVFFTLTETASTLKEFTVETEPVEGRIFVDSVFVGEGRAKVPHDFGIYNITFGDVDGWHTPEPVRLTITPTKPRPDVKGIYTRIYHAYAEASGANTALSEDLHWNAGIYFDDTGTQASKSLAPKVKKIPDSDKFGWELAMGDANKNPMGVGYIEFTFTLPDDVGPDAPLNLKLYLYRSKKSYPLVFTSRSELEVTVNGKSFLDGYRPKYETSEISPEHFEEWSLQKTLVAGENKIRIRATSANQVYNYLWKIEIL